MDNPEGVPPGAVSGGSRFGRGSVSSVVPLSAVAILQPSGIWACGLWCICEIFENDTAGRGKRLVLANRLQSHVPVRGFSNEIGAADRRTAVSPLAIRCVVDKDAMIRRRRSQRFWRWGRGFARKDDGIFDSEAVAGTIAPDERGVETCAF